MEVEHLIRYSPRAVGVNPLARQGEARLRGLERIISSKTISPRLSKTKPACAGYTELFRAYPNNPAARTAITPQAKRFQFFG